MASMRLSDKKKNNNNNNNINSIDSAP